MKRKKMEPIDLTKTLENYEGMWVILSKDLKEVLFSGKNAEDILAHVDSGIIMKVSQFSGSFVPHIK